MRSRVPNDTGRTTKPRADRKRARVAIAAVFCAAGLIPLFQNCAPGFEATTALPLASSGELENLIPNDPSARPARVFARDPYSDHGATIDVSLNGLDDSGLLQGPYVAIKTDTFFADRIARSTGSANFIFAPDAPELDQTNAFYHAMQTVQKYRALGVDLGQFKPVPIDAHCDIENNAFFRADLHSICLGWADYGTGKQYAARDGDVTAHEMNHGLNRFLASNEIYATNPELLAIDEGTSDFWANVSSKSPDLAWYFGTAIYGSMVRIGDEPQPRPLRTADLSGITYPEFLVHEPHADGSIVSTLLWRAYTATASANRQSFLQGVLETMKSLQANDGLKQFCWKLLSQMRTAGIDISVLTADMKNFGLYRTDSLANVQVSATQPIVVVDALVSGITDSVNCDRQLQAGETAIVMVNFLNSGPQTLSNFTAKLTAVTPSAGLTILDGGDIGYIIRLLPNKDLISSLPQSSGSGDFTFRHGAIFSAGFLLKATAAGTYNLSLQIQSFSSQTANAQSGSLNVPLTVAAATSSTCVNGAGAWP